MPKRLKRAEDDQMNKMAKKAQNGMRINPAEILGNVNWIKEKYMASLKEAQHA